MPTPRAHNCRPPQHPASHPNTAVSHLVTQRKVGCLGCGRDGSVGASGAPWTGRHVCWVLSATRTIGGVATRSCGAGTSRRAVWQRTSSPTLTAATFRAARDREAAARGAKRATLLVVLEVNCCMAWNEGSVDVGLAVTVKTRSTGGAYESRRKARRKSAQVVMHCWRALLRYDIDECGSNSCQAFQLSQHLRSRTRQARARG